MHRFRDSVHHHHGLGALGAGWTESGGVLDPAHGCGITSTTKTVVPSWTKRLSTCPKCQAVNDKSEVHARQNYKPYWKRWNCRGWQKQTWASAWKCECGLLIPQCETRSQDPREQKTINHRWLPEHAGRREVDAGGSTAELRGCSTAVVKHRL